MTLEAHYFHSLNHHSLSNSKWQNRKTRPYRCTKRGMAEIAKRLVSDRDYGLCN